MKFNEKDKAIIMGLLLGDGYISPNGRISIEHCEKQKNYCIFKAKLLHTVCGGKEIKVRESIRTRSKLKNGKEWRTPIFTTYSFRRQSVDLKQFRNLLYKENKKTITKEILNMLNSVSIALWWLDDGNVCEKHTHGKKCGYNLRLYTFLSKKENELIRDFFIQKYNVVWNVVPTEDTKRTDLYMLRCGSIEGRKFLAIIRDFVREKIPDMSYKVIDI